MTETTGFGGDGFTNLWQAREKWCMTYVSGGKWARHFVRTGNNEVSKFASVLYYHPLVQLLKILTQQQVTTQTGHYAEGYICVHTFTNGHVGRTRAGISTFISVWAIDTLQALPLTERSNAWTVLSFMKLALLPESKHVPGGFEQLLAWLMLLNIVDIQNLFHKVKAELIACRTCPLWIDTRLGNAFLYHTWGSDRSGRGRPSFCDACTHNRSAFCQLRAPLLDSHWSDLDLPWRVILKTNHYWPLGLSCGQFHLWKLRPSEQRCRRRHSSAPFLELLQAYKRVLYWQFIFFHESHTNRGKT